MSKTYHGSCICGAVNYEADIDFSKGTGKCNCTICGKLRFWGVQVKPDSFKLLSPSSDEAMSDYIMKNDAIHNLFCKTCGVHAFHRLNLPQMGGEFVSINIACLDDVGEIELAGLKVRYADGKADNWWNEPKETKHL